MPPAKNSPPKTIRRKSLRASVRDVFIDDLPDAPFQETGTTEGSAEFSIIVPKLRNKLNEVSTRILKAFASKLAGASDPDYPKSEIIQQVLQSAASLYTACQITCTQICDVPDDSVLIKYCFAMCAETLFRVTFDLITPGISLAFLDCMTPEIIEDARRTKSSRVSFAENDVETYVMIWAKRFGLYEDQKRSISPAKATQTPPKFEATKTLRDSVASDALRVPPIPDGVSGDLNAKTAHLLGELGRLTTGKTLVRSVTLLTNEVVQEALSKLAQVRREREANRFSQGSQLM